jgi:uncharacterized protein YhdP
MSAALAVQVIVGIAYGVLSVLWPRGDYRRLDPALRRRLSRTLGVPVVWVQRRGGWNNAPLVVAVARVRSPPHPHTASAG